MLCALESVFIHWLSAPRRGATGPAEGPPGHQYEEITRLRLGCLVNSYILHIRRYRCYICVCYILHIPVYYILHIFLYRFDYLYEGFTRLAETRLAQNSLIYLSIAWTTSYVYIYIYIDIDIDIDTHIIIHVYIYIYTHTSNWCCFTSYVYIYIYIYMCIYIYIYFMQ